MLETELASKIIDWLKNQHWEVYQEVEPKGLNRGIADIVAVSGPITWIVEVKTSMSLALLEQAYTWKGYANFISVAIPTAKRWSKGRAVAEAFLRNEGIGLITYNPYMLGYRREDYHGINVMIQPRINRKISLAVKNSLNEHQKHYAQAGSANGRRWTPFNQTCLELQRIAKASPGISLKAAIDGIKHHYMTDSTARACIAKYLQMEGVVKGVRCEKDGRYVRLYAIEEK
jgi:hypothetical protein